MSSVIYPSDIFAAADAFEAKLKASYEKKGTPEKKTNPFGAFRINFESPTTSTHTSYFKFEVNLIDGRGWTPVSLKFFNLKHVGRISALNGDKLPRSKAQVQAVQVLFKEDYVFTRKAQKDGKVRTITERYGAVKSLINDAYLQHVKLAKRKGNLPSNANVTSIVKREKNQKNDKGINTKVKIDGPGNINVNIKFFAEKGKQPDTMDPNTTFRCPILDARFKRVNRTNDDWAWDDAKLEDADGERTITLNNGNIHQFLRGGSLISGVENMGAVCLSQGQTKISLPCKLDVCIVRPAAAQRVSQSDFDESDMDSIDTAQDPAPEPFKDDSEIDAGIETHSAQAGEFDDIVDLDDNDNDTTITDGDDFGDPTPEDDDDLFDDDI